jgi:hypothetical protein
MFDDDGSLVRKQVDNPNILLRDVPWFIQDIQNPDHLLIDLQRNR